MKTYVASAGHRDCEPCICIAATTSEKCLSALDEAILEEQAYWDDQEDMEPADIWYVGPFLETDLELTPDQEKTLLESGVAWLDC